MIERLATQVVREIAAQFPAVLILGPRHCGKTTLARHFLEGEYLDLERPSDSQIFAGDAELALRRLGCPLILDEAQTRPELFSILRALIDEERQQTGRYYLLDSVNPALGKRISESLAGRVGIVELTPFLFPEASRLGMNLEAHWLRGGFPDACVERTEARWLRWQENYVRTFVERDLLRVGPKTSPTHMRRLLGMVAHYHGGILNASDFGRSLGVSYHTVTSYLDLLEAHYLLRRLQPYHANIGKRLVKSPKIYLRDTGVVHYLLGIANERLLLQAPQRGRSWEGYLVEQTICHEQLSRAGSQFYFFRTHAGGEIDLIVDRGQERIGFEFKAALSVVPGDWANLQRGLGDGVIGRGYVVYLGQREFTASERIQVVNATNFLASPTSAV
jgi:predicted AAA+ superfamily ATPase